MGTQLLARGLRSGHCGMLWNTDQPDDVRAIHTAYRAAGCDLLTTNSFGGSRFPLAHHGLEHRLAELNRAAAALAREAACDDAWVLGDIGPCGDFLEPVGDLAPDDVRAAFLAQATALLEGGADALLVETLSDPAEAVLGIEAARLARPGVPVLATFAFRKTAPGLFRTMMGTTPGQAVAAVIAAGADVVGANCGTGLDLDDYATLARQLVAAAGATPVIVQPNAGLPRVAGDTTFYDATPAQMAAAAAELVRAGVRIVGGCCGTDPSHLAAMTAAVRAAP